MAKRQGRVNTFFDIFLNESGGEKPHMNTDKHRFEGKGVKKTAEYAEYAEKVKKSDKNCTNFHKLRKSLKLRLIPRISRLSSVRFRAVQQEIAVEGGGVDVLREVGIGGWLNGDGLDQLEVRGIVLPPAVKYTR